MTVLGVGAIFFGIVVGWITSRTLRRVSPSGLTDIATVLGVVGGAAVTELFKPTDDSFGLYCIGLFVGFFAYLIIAIRISHQEGTPVGDWLGSEPGRAAATSWNPPPPPSAARTT